MFGARFAVFVRQARVLPSPCPATRNLSFLRFHRHRHPVVSIVHWAGTGWFESLQLDVNNINVYGHVILYRTYHKIIYLSLYYCTFLLLFLHDRFDKILCSTPLFDHRMLENLMLYILSIDQCILFFLTSPTRLLLIFWHVPDRLPYLHVDKVIILATDNLYK